MSYSLIFCAIILYIIIILIIAISKPELIYDHANNKFKEFGLGENKSLITIITLGIIISFIVYNFIIIIIPRNLNPLNHINSINPINNFNMDYMRYYY